MERPNGNIYEFGDFRLIPDEGLLLRNGSAVPLPPKAFATLVVLVERHGHLVEKSDLINRIWENAFVEESAVSRCVWGIRNALGEDPKKATFIQTVPKRGYRFVADVSVIEEGEGPANGNHSIAREIPYGRNGNGFSKRDEHRDLSLSTSSVLHPVGQNGDRERLLLRSAVDPRPGPATALSPNHGTRPGKSVRGIRPMLAMTAVTVSILGLLAIYFFTAAPINSGGKHSVAVLPLKPVNIETRDSIYELGITDSVILKISSSRNLVVRQLHAVRKYVDIDRDLIEIGKEQNVDFVLASNYQIAGGKIKVTSQLLEVATGTVEDTFTVEKDSTNLFSAQDAIADAIGGKLIARFGGASRGFELKRGTVNEEAYRLYLQGMYLVEKGDKAGTKRSIELFDKALELDPNYAAAWAGKGHAHCAYSHMGDNSPAAEYEIAGPAIERALELDSNLPQAYAILGIINTDFGWNLAEGEKHFLRAIELNPSSDYAYRWYGNRLANFGRFDEAVEAMKTAIDNNPTNIFHLRTYGWVLYLARRHDKAIEELERVVEMDPSFVSAYGNLWMAYNAKGDHARAFEWFMKFHRQAGTDSQLINEFNSEYQRTGWQGVLRTQRNTLLATEREGTFSPNHYRIAALSALVGDKDQALEFLNEAIKYRSANITFLKTDPSLDSLRGDPRFDELMRRAGL